MTENNDVDELLEDAIKIAIQYDRVSTSIFERKFVIGYARASKLMDQLETLKVVGKSRGAKPREVLIHSLDKVLKS